MVLEPFCIWQLCLSKIEPLKRNPLSGEFAKFHWIIEVLDYQNIGKNLSHISLFWNPPLLFVHFGHFWSWVEMIRLKLLTDEIGARLPQIIQKVRKTLKPQGERYNTRCAAIQLQPHNHLIIYMYILCIYIRWTRDWLVFVRHL